jgi:hypothetical protein
VKGWWLVRIWKSKRSTRLAVASIAMGVTISLVAPPGAASAAAVPSGPPPTAAVDQPRPDTPDAHTMNPSPPSDSAPSGSGPSQGPSAPPAADPPQRKDKPPDRDPHKFSPAKHSTDGQQSSAGDGDNNNDNDNGGGDDSAPAPAPVPSTGSGEGTPGPQLGPADTRYGAMADGLWGAATCAAAIAMAIAGGIVPIAKVLKIKQLIKAVGGLGKLAKKIAQTFEKVRKGGMKIEQAVRDVFKDLGSAAAGIAAEILGIQAIIDNC